MMQAIIVLVALIGSTVAFVPRMAKMSNTKSMMAVDPSAAYFPEFGGSTGGWLQAAETEEKYVMTWTNARNKVAVEENIFEMPTGGAAIMKQGPNLVYFARKEQCLALGKQLQTNFKIKDYRVFRLLPSGEIQFIHPKDGVFPEKVNEGRVAVGSRGYSIGKNPDPATLKFTGTPTFEAPAPMK